MVALEGLAKTGGIWTCKMLLPVQPPEIHTFRFMVADYVLKERIRKIGIIKISGNFAITNISTVKFLAHCIVIRGRFDTVNAISRMEI